jgi:hypothetical protein
MAAGCRMTAAPRRPALQPRRPGLNHELRLPYDWRRPTLARVKQRWWNPADRRLFTPKVFGWGLDLNLYELVRRLRMVQR